MTREQEEKLNRVHCGLLDEIESAQRNLPSDVECVSEAFERHARIISLLVRALESMTRLEKQKHQEQSKQSDPQARFALLADIEKRFAKLVSQSSESSPDKGAEQ